MTVAVPGCVPAESLRVDADGWCEAPHIWPAVTPDDRLYLAASRVDLGDQEAVTAFSREHGLLVPLAAPPWEDLGLDSAAYIRAVIGHAEQVAPGIASPSPSRLATRHRIDHHWTEISYRLRVVRQLVRHVIAWRRGDYVAATWPECENDDEAWLRFKKLADAALSPFRVRIVLLHDNPELTHDVAAPSLYNVLMLQLANDVRLLVDYSICASCGNDFVHQERAGKTLHRLAGVLYCSTRCKNREMTRRYRAKRREGGTG